MTKTKKKPREEVVKVQMSFPNKDGQDTVLVYNEDRSVTFMGLADDEIRKMMNGKPKKFFHGFKDRETGVFSFGKEAPWREW